MAVAAYEYDDAISIADVDCLSSQDRAGVQCSRHRGLENLPEGEYQIIFLLFFLQIAQSQINAQINLAASPGTWGSCGVKYDPKTEERRVAIGEISTTFQR